MNQRDALSNDSFPWIIRLGQILGFKTLNGFWKLRVLGEKKKFISCISAFVCLHQILEFTMKTPRKLLNFIIIV